MVEEHAAGLLIGDAGPETRTTDDRPGCPRGSDPAGFPSGKVAIATGGELVAVDVDDAVAREVVTGTLVAHD